MLHTQPLTIIYKQDFTKLPILVQKTSSVKLGSTLSLSSASKKQNSTVY